MNNSVDKSLSATVRSESLKADAQREYEDSSLNPEIAAYLTQYDFDIQIGDEFISHEYARIIRVTAIYIKPNPYRKDEAGTMYVDYEYIQGGNGKGGNELKDFKPNDDGSCKWYKLYAPFEQVKKDALASLMTGDQPLQKTDNADEKRLTVTSGSAAIKAADRRLRDEKNRLAVMKQTIELLMGNIRNQIGAMTDQIKYTTKILRLLETFMGVYEQIVLIKEGEKAPIDTPITIRQLILYADEEVANIDYSDGQYGIDFRRLDEFDKWVTTNYMQVVPEEKCIVAIKPTRQSRDYGDMWSNLGAAKANSAIYILIRNGECLYRVYTDLVMHEKLFASSEEMERVNNMLMSDNYSSDDNHFYTKDRAKDEDFYWKQNAVLLQGLIMRTEVLQPTPFPISLFETRSYDTGMLNLIRDAEPSLTSGNPTFKEWREQLNRKIKLGTRVVMGIYHGYSAKEYGHYHFKGNYYHSFPALPERGIYVIDEAYFKIHEWDRQIRDDKNPFKDTGKVEHVIKHSTDLRFLYTPHEYRKRSKRVAFYFDTDDEFFMNYDDVELEDVTYYLNNRLERRNYLDIMPLLISIRNEKMREQQYEAPLVDMIAVEFNCDKSIVWDCIKWWKLKTQLHRWIETDDAKAWRMIRRKVKKLIEGDTADEL